MSNLDIVTTPDGSEELDRQRGLQRGPVVSRPTRRRGFVPTLDVDARVAYSPPTRPGSQVPCNTASPVAVRHVESQWDHVDVPESSRRASQNHWRSAGHSSCCSASKAASSLLTAARWRQTQTAPPARPPVAR